MFNEREENGKRVRDPVPGVKISVADATGQAVGDATTDAQGAYEIPLPSPGDYKVTLDESTLPKGVTVRADTPSERTVNVRPGETQTANYFLGKDLRKKESRLSILPQTIANGVKFGLIISICAVGLSLIYGTTGPVQLRPRRARGPRRHRGLVLQPVRTADPHPARRRPRHPRGHGSRVVARRA